MVRTQTDFRRTGWPWAFRVEAIHQGSPERVSILHQSLRNGIFNLLFGILCMGAVAAFTWQRYRHVARAAHANRVRFWYDLVSILGCLLIPACVIVVSNRIATEHHRFATRIAPYGASTLTAELPAWLAQRVPPVMQRAFLRVRKVELKRPPQRLIDQTLQISTLRGIHISDTELKGNALSRLDDSHELMEILLNNCQTDSDSMSALSDHSQLHTLSLRSCSLDRSDLKKLNRLRRLENVDLSDAQIVLDDFHQTGWAGSVRSLSLPMPKLGVDGEIQLKNWMVLEELQVQENRLHGGNPNVVPDATVTLSLSNCPSLKSLFLMNSRQYDLFASGLPALEHIVEPSEINFITSVEFTDRGMPRWRHVQLDRVPRLKKLDCAVADLKSLRFRGTKRLRKITIGKPSGSRSGRTNQDTKTYQHVNQWIAAISELPYVESLWLDSIHLGPAQLSVIADIDTLKELRLTHCDLSNDQCDPIVRMRSLENLNLHTCKIDSQRLDQFLALPRLKRLTVDLSDVEQVSITNLPRLQRIETLPMRNLTSLHLENLSSLAGPVVVQGSIARLNVSNTPRLTGILVECPWPEDFQLENLERLHRFAAGGPRLDDSVLEPLLECPHLDRLTLAYSSISRSGLKRIGALSALTALEVPGSEIDDEIVEHWQTLSRLRRICLDGAQVSEQMAVWMTSLGTLRSLSLNHASIAPEACRWLASLPKLSELSLAQTPVPHRWLIHLLRHNGLEMLNVSGHEISQELIEAIASADELQVVTMLDCQMSVNQIQYMLARNTKLQLVHCIDDVAPDTLSDSIRKRIHESKIHYYSQNLFPNNHRVMILSQDYIEDDREITLNRPFNVDRFRQERSDARTPNRKRSIH